MVARTILSEMLSEGTEYQYLDLRHLPAEKMHARFPTISAICRQYGLDLASDLLPVAPAAHYCMGGVRVDSHGRTSVPGLYAVGEVACTGVHGANRLASNSLLEGLVYGIRVADDLVQHTALPAQPSLDDAASLVPYDDSPDSSLQEGIPSSGRADGPISGQIRQELRKIMWQYVSLCRDQDGLLEARRKVQALRRELAAASERPHEQVRRRLDYAETLNMLLVADLVIAAALQRRESRGSHWRLDYQSLDAGLTGHHYVFQRRPADPDGLLRTCKEARSHA